MRRDVRALTARGGGGGGPAARSLEVEGEGKDAASGEVPPRRLGPWQVVLVVKDASASRRPTAMGAFEGKDGRAPGRLGDVADEGDGAVMGEVSRSGNGEEMERVGRLRAVTRTIAAAERRLCVDERTLGRMAATGEVGREVTGVSAREGLRRSAGSSDGVREVAGSGGCEAWSSWGGRRFLCNLGGSIKCGAI